MTRAVKSMMVLGILAMGVVAVSGVLSQSILIPVNEEHIRERGRAHVLPVMGHYREGGCDGKWVYYSPTTGQIMVVCGIPDTNPKECLFIPFKVTEILNGEIVVLDADDAYNNTVVVDRCWKGNRYKGTWNEPGERGFVKWVEVPLDLRSAIKQVFGRP